MLEFLMVYFIFGFLMGLYMAVGESKYEPGVSVVMFILWPIVMLLSLQAFLAAKISVYLQEQKTRRSNETRKNSGG